MNTTMRTLWKISLGFNTVSMILNVATGDQAWAWMGFGGFAVSLLALVTIPADEEKDDE